VLADVVHLVGAARSAAARSVNAVMTATLASVPFGPKNGVHFIWRKPHAWSHQAAVTRSSLPSGQALTVAHARPGLASSSRAQCARIHARNSRSPFLDSGSACDDASTSSSRARASDCFPKLWRAFTYPPVYHAQPGIP
jgi:hypothetical protein